jgi:tetratricopeptide (TPR) repeat protein/DNA-binding CsgD family transcriptional regulator
VFADDDGPIPFSPMALDVHRVSGDVVGRPAELRAIEQELAAARSGRLVGITLEGEPGIGKTRLLLAAADRAAAAGSTVIAVTADEELQGPFLVARSILGSPEAMQAATQRQTSEALRHCLDSMSGQDDPGLASLPPDRRLLRTFDLGAVAFRALAVERPLAVLIDDLQWSDEDSLRLLRYVVRTDGASPIFLMFAIRPEEFAFVSEAVNLVADMGRMGVVRRLRVERFSQAETRELVTQTLGGPVDGAGAAVMHAQAEGVPFIVEEMANAYREAGMIQQIDGVWTLAGNADRLVPSAVKTLISRRAAKLPDPTKRLLALAAILGRRFSLQDLREVQLRVDGAALDPAALAETLAPAVEAGLLIEQQESSAADYSFQHEQVREFASATLSAPARRDVHQAIVALLMSGEPSPASLPLLATHAKAAGDGAVCVRFSVEASRNALAANAPEAVLRVVELALPSASTPQERVNLLDARDRALDMLRRPADRMQGLAELAALAEALGDERLQIDVQLRRAAALRTAEEYDRAAELAREVRQLAVTRGDRASELAACMELGQDLLHAAAGESFGPIANEVDLDGAEEAFTRAIELGEDAGDDPIVAAASREAGVIELSRIRGWFVEQVELGRHIPIAQRVAAGETLEDIAQELPIAPGIYRAFGLFQRALELYERLGDRRGAMSTIIALAYLSWAPDIHMGSNAGRHIEEIRRLTSTLRAFTNESERAALEAQMLYGSHVFGRAKVIPDMALTKGRDAYRYAGEIGDRALQFLAAGGTGLSYLDLGDVDEARAWIDRAATVASELPSPHRARKLETWRGIVDAAAGDTRGMREHLEQAVQQATDAGHAASRCDALARLAVESARLATSRNDEELMELADRTGIEASELSDTLPGHAPWGAQADAARALVALARGSAEEATALALAAAGAMRQARHEDLNLDVLLPVARVLKETGAPEWESELRPFLQLSLAMVAQRTIDEDVRVRWLRGPSGARMVELAGSLDVAGGGTTHGNGDGPPDEDRRLLESLVHGKTNREIGEDLGIDETMVTRRLGELFATIGVSSRADATAFAFRERIL